VQQAVSGGQVLPARGEWIKGHSLIVDKPVYMAL